MKETRSLFALILFTLLSGCATLAPETARQANPSAEQYYSEARKAQASGDHAGAIQAFAELENRYPLSPYARLAPLEIAYARYKLEQYAAAAAEVDRYITTHPDHAHLDYAYYLKGLIHSAQGTDTPAAGPGQQLIVDSEHARDAFRNFSILVQRFPDSDYRNNALQRMSRLRSLLARQELETVKNRIEQGEYEAAVRHAKYIAEQYPKTPAARTALELITASASTATPNIEVMPVTAPITPAPMRESIHREEWLLQQDPQHFTLQIAGTSNREGLQRYIEQYKLQDHSAYFRRTHNDKNWYSLLYGNYSSRDEAIDAAARLKAELGLDNIWIRRFNGVQASIMEGHDN